MQQTIPQTTSNQNRVDISVSKSTLFECAREVTEILCKNLNVEDLSKIITCVSSCLSAVDNTQEEEERNVDCCPPTQKGQYADRPSTPTRKQCAPLKQNCVHTSPFSASTLPPPAPPLPKWNISSPPPSQGSRPGRRPRSKPTEECNKSLPFAVPFSRTNRTPGSSCKEEPLQQCTPPTNPSPSPSTLLSSLLKVVASNGQDGKTDLLKNGIDLVKSALKSGVLEPTIGDAIDSNKLFDNMRDHIGNVFKEVGTTPNTPSSTNTPTTPSTPLSVSNTFPSPPPRPNAPKCGRSRNAAVPLKVPTVNTNKVSSRNPWYVAPEEDNCCPKVPYYGPVRQPQYYKEDDDYGCTYVCPSEAKDNTTYIARQVPAKETRANSYYDDTSLYGNEDNNVRRCPFLRENVRGVGVPLCNESETSLEHDCLYPKSDNCVPRNNIWQISSENFCDEMCPYYVSKEQYMKNPSMYQYKEDTSSPVPKKNTVTCTQVPKSRTGRRNITPSVCEECPPLPCEENVPSFLNRREPFHPEETEFSANDRFFKMVNDLLNVESNRTTSTPHPVFSSPVINNDYVTSLGCQFYPSFY